MSRQNVKAGSDSAGAEMQRLYSGAGPDEIATDLGPLVDFQSEPMPLDQLQAMVAERLVPHLMRYDSPGFHSMFNSAPEYAARVGAELALAFNQGVTNWQVSPGGAMLEEMCCRALCRLFALGDSADATFMYSGTYANQEALYLALHRYAARQGVDLAQKGFAGLSRAHRLVVLVSEDAHFSLRHAVRMLGLGEQSLVRLPVDAQRRIDMTKARQIVQDLAREREIICIVATAGTTSTGSVDPIDALADLSAETGAWLHIDGAYGYAYKLVPEWASLFVGDDQADSISWDPHKQLGIPIPNSLLFVREQSDFARMALHSDYFNRDEDAEPDPGLKSPPSTRPMSVLPLVMSLRARGLAQVIEDLRQPLAAIRELADVLATWPDVKLWQRPHTGILCFQVTPEHVTPGELSELRV